MTRAIPINSIVAYHSIGNIDERQLAVYNVVKECPGASAAEITCIMRRRGHGVQGGSVTPRLTELVNIGSIKVTGRKINRRTGRPGNMYEAV